MREDWEDIIYENAVYKISTSKQKLKQKQYLKNGKVPIVDQGQDLIGGYTNDENRIIECDLPVLVFGDHTKITKLIDFKFAPGADGTKILEPSKFVLPEYLSIFTKVLTYKIKDNGYARHYQHIEKELFPLAPLPIQRAIVSKTEELFSDLDNGIANFKKAQEQLKVYRQAVLKKAFEGKLSETLINNDFSDDIDLEKSNQSFNQKNHNSDNFPNGWKWVKISEIAEINPSLPNKSEIDKNIEVQFLPMKLVEEIINKIHLTESRVFADITKGSYTPFIDGDIIFAKVTPCMENGKIAIVNRLKNGIGFGSSEFHVLRCSDKILNRYLHFFVVQDKFRNEAQNAMTGAVGLRRVPKQFIENYIIPLPPTIEEQAQIVQEIESRLSVCDKMEQSITESIGKAEALRQSILKKAFEGKLLSEAELAQCKQAADYEPASELLKKIKAEKLAKEQERKKTTNKKKSKQ